jgi:ligand-binding sensor domain-containing protein/signal transduction histidine kinase
LQSSKRTRSALALIARGFVLILVLDPSPARATDPALDPSRPPHHYGQESWTTDDGLPSNTIRDIVQTADGYLWLATHAGLARFDGVRFKTFDTSNSPGLESNFLTELVLGRDGTLWIGSNSGLVRYRDREFTTLGIAEGLSGERVEALLEDSDGTLWVAAGGEAHRVEDERLRIVERPEGLSAGRINSVFAGANGELWFTTRNHGLLRWRSDEWSELKAADELEQKALWFGYRDRAENLWLAASGPDPVSLVRYGEQDAVAYRKGELASGRIRAMHESRDGTLWMAASGALLRLGTDGFHSLALDSPLADRRFMTVFEDREGSVWTSTYSGGLLRLSDGPISSYAELDGLGGAALAIYEDRQQTLWVGGGLGLFRLEGNRFVSVGGIGGPVRAIAEDSTGALWLGTNRALVRYESGQVEEFPTDQPVVLVFFDREGTVYVSLLDIGVTRFTDGRFQPIEELRTRFVRWMDQGTDGDLWIGTVNDGLARLRGDGSVSWLTTADGLPSNALLAHLRDDSGALWMGTEGRGIARLEGDTIRTYSSAEGLHDDNVWPILEDSQGNLWMGGDRGIFRVRKRDFARLDAGEIAQLDSIDYDHSDGLKVPEGAGMGEPSGWRTTDGRLWFTMTRGVAAVDPGRIGSGPPPPPVLIEEILENGHQVPGLEPLELAPRNRELEIHFTATSFFKPGQIRFQYRLDGYDESWSDAVARRSAHYTQLPPRRYRFQVRARHANGEWSEAVQLRLAVAPAWWQTWWLRGVATLAVLGLLVGVYRARARANARRTEQLQRDLDERRATEEALKRTLQERERVQLAMANSEELSRATLDSLSAQVAVLDTEGRILRVNETWRQFASENGASTELVEGIGLDYLEVCRRASGDAAAQARQCLAGLQSVLDGTTSIFDLEYDCHSPRRKRSFLLRVVPLGTPRRGAVVSHIDMTERRLAETALEASRKHQRQQREELTHVQRVTSMGELVGALSHELNQPLAAIRSNTQAAARYLQLPEPDLTEIGEILDDIVQDNRRATAVMRGLRGLLKKQPFSARRLDVNGVIDEVRELLGSEAVLRRVDVSLELEPDPPEVWADRVQLQQVLVNLMMNGFEAMEEVRLGQRRLFVRTATEPGAVRISVLDSGQGLGDRDPEHLFQAFETTRATGLGMGLSIARSVVEAHGGRIWAENNAGQGAAFHFTLPISVEEPEEGSSNGRSHADT